jgi:hypothetical protein
MGEKRLNAKTSAGKLMASVFWTSEGMSLMELLKRGDTINVRTCKEVITTNLKVLAKQVDNSNPNPMNVPGLAPSSFHIIGPLKDALRGRCLADDDELKHSMCEELRRFSIELTRRAYSVSRNDGNRMFIAKILAEK